jgi:methylmalonyl-CoA epimerase
MKQNVRLDHVAIATSEPEKLKKLFTLIGLTDGGTEAVPSQGVMTHFQNLAAGPSAIELLEPTDPRGVIAQFLAKRGPGIHHLCVLVPDVAALCEKLRKEQIRLIYPVPQVGAHGAKVNFIHPASAGGVLVELSQKG